MKFPVFLIWQRFSFASSQINWQIAILQDIYSKAQVVKVHIKPFENKNIIFNPLI